MDKAVDWLEEDLDGMTEVTTVGTGAGPGLYVVRTWGGDARRHKGVIVRPIFEVLAANGGSASGSTFRPEYSEEYERGSAWE